MRCYCNEEIVKTVKGIAKGIEGKKVLDVGCGLGSFTELFCLNDNEVVGIDIERRGDTKSSKFTFVQGNALEMPFPDSSFDIVISIDVIEHIADDLRFLNECRRVLRSNGRFYLGTPNRHRLSFFLLTLFGQKPVFPRNLGSDEYLGEIIHLREYTPQEIKELLLASEFAVEKVLNVWFGLACKRREIGLSRPPFSFLSRFASWILVEATKQ